MGWLSDLFGGGDAPDTSGINQAAVDTAALSREYLDWLKQTYADGAGERASATTRANAVADAQVGAMNFATEEARRLSDRNRTVFQPLEDRLVTNATNYDTPGRRQQASAEARADVEQAFGGAQDALTRATRRTGGTTGGGRSAALMSDWAIQKAKANAGASTTAVKNVEQQGYARQMDAAALGRGIASSQATQQQIASTTGNSAVGAGGAALAASNSGIPAMQGGYSTSMQGMQTVGNLYGQAAKIQADASAGNNAAMMQGIGGIAQGIGAYYSSKDVKHDKRDIDEKEALDAVNAVPVEAWKYNEGVADEGTHIGPYAQDVQKASGDKKAPRGVMVNMAELGKQNTSAIQALSRELEGLEKKIAELESA
jgi:polyhydroxyalkanoate synthesis regulator phasin